MKMQSPPAGKTQAGPPIAFISGPHRTHPPGGVLSTSKIQPCYSRTGHISPFNMDHKSDDGEEVRSWGGDFDPFSDPEERRVLFAAFDSFR